MSVPNSDHAIDALLHTLRAGTGRPWGDEEAPDPPVGDPDYPYGFLELIPGGEVYGDVGQPSSMRDIVVQLTAVAPTRKGATALAARAFQVMLAMAADGYTSAITPAPPTVVISREHDSSGGVLREGPLHNAVDRYVLTLSVE